MDLELLKHELDQALLTPLLRSVPIPPRPSLLADVQAELQREEPDAHRLTQLVGADVAMSAALLKLANSPLLGLSRRAETVEQAFGLLGLRRLEALLVEIALRRALPGQGPALLRFWDVASHRSRAMAHLAQRERLCPPPLAHTFGLFMDMGIALLMLRPCTPPYLNTLEIANASLQPFTQIERERHGTDHCLVGAAMAREWGVSQTVLLAVRLHHDYGSLHSPALPRLVRDLIALALVVEHIIQRYEGLNQQLEWQKGGEAAMAALALDERTLEDWTDDVHELLRQEL